MNDFSKVLEDLEQCCPWKIYDSQVFLNFLVVKKIFFSGSYIKKYKEMKLILLIYLI